MPLPKRFFRLVKDEIFIDEVCEVPGCDRPVDALDMCKLHYNKQYKLKQKSEGRQPQQCPVDGCTVKTISKSGVCRKHERSAMHDICAELDRRRSEVERPHENNA